MSETAEDAPVELEQEQQQDQEQEDVQEASLEPEEAVAEELAAEEDAGATAESPDFAEEYTDQGMTDEMLMRGDPARESMNVSNGYEEPAHADYTRESTSGLDQSAAGPDESPQGTPREAQTPQEADSDDDDMPMPNRMAAINSRGSSRYSRPGSAVINLRGSRPNSAAIAQEIEGFEDDFMERVEEEQEQEVMEESDEESDMGPSIEELIERAQVEQSRLLEQNEAMQRRVRLALDFRNKGRPPVNRDLSRLDGASTRYRSALRQWMDVLEERDRVESHYQTTIFDMKSTLEERIKRADDISKAYKHFRLEVAKSGEHSKTGRPISDRLLAQLEQEDQLKEEEVQRVRLKNIHLSNQLKRIEQTLRQKEELAEGLHLIDFEQLKIENQSLNEKIEERNEELLKLKKKTTTTVQILTHVREKLQFVEKENAQLDTVLNEFEKDLGEKRDRLNRAKVSRDSLRLKGRRIKDNSVFITTPNLLDDIEGQKEHKERLLSEIEEARLQYTALNEHVMLTHNKLMHMADDVTVPASFAAHSTKGNNTIKSIKA